MLADRPPDSWRRPHVRIPGAHGAGQGQSPGAGVATGATGLPPSRSVVIDYDSEEEADPFAGHTAASWHTSSQASIGVGDGELTSPGYTRDTASPMPGHHRNAAADHDPFASSATLSPSLPQTHSHTDAPVPPPPALSSSPAVPPAQQQPYPLHAPAPAAPSASHTPTDRHPPPHSQPGKTPQHLPAHQSDTDPDTDSDSSEDNDPFSGPNARRRARARSVPKPRPAGPYAPSRKSLRPPGTQSPSARHTVSPASRPRPVEAERAIPSGGSAKPQLQLGPARGAGPGAGEGSSGPPGGPKVNGLAAAAAAAAVPYAQSPSGPGPGSTFAPPVAVRASELSVGPHPEAPPEAAVQASGPSVKWHDEHTGQGNSLRGAGRGAEGAGRVAKGKGTTKGKKALEPWKLRALGPYSMDLDDSSDENEGEQSEGGSEPEDSGAAAGAAVAGQLASELGGREAPRGGVELAAAPAGGDVPGQGQGEELATVPRDGQSPSSWREGGTGGGEEPATGDEWGAWVQEAQGEGVEGVTEVAEAGSFGAETGALEAGAGEEATDSDAGAVAAGEPRSSRQSGDGSSPFSAPDVAPGLESTERGVQQAPVRQDSEAPMRRGSSKSVSREVVHGSDSGQPGHGSPGPSAMQGQPLEPDTRAPPDPPSRRTSSVNSGHGSFRSRRAAATGLTVDTGSPPTAPHDVPVAAPHALPRGGSLGQPLPLGGTAATSRTASLDGRPSLPPRAPSGTPPAMLSPAASRRILSPRGTAAAPPAPVHQSPQLEAAPDQQAPDGTAEGVVEGSLAMAPSRAQSVRLGLVAASRRASMSADAEPSFAVLDGRLPSEAQSAASASSAAEPRGSATAALAAAAVPAADGVDSPSVCFTGAQPAASSVDFDWAAVAAEVEAAEALTEDWEGMSFAAAAAAAGEEDGRTVASMSMQGAELDAFSDVASEAVGGASLRPGGAALARAAAHSVGGASVLSGEGSAVRVGTRLYVPSDILESDAGSVLGAYSPGPGTDRVGPPSEAWEGEQGGTEEGEGLLEESEDGSGAAGGKEDGEQSGGEEGHLALVREDDGDEGAAKEVEQVAKQEVPGRESGAEAGSGPGGAIVAEPSLASAADGRVEDGPPQTAMAGTGVAAVKVLRRTSSGAVPAPDAAMQGRLEEARRPEGALTSTSSPAPAADSHERPEQAQQQPQRQRPSSRSRSSSTRSSASSVAGTGSKTREKKGQGSSTAPASAAPPPATSQRPPRSLLARRPATTTCLPDDLECVAAVTGHARASEPILPATPSPLPLLADQSPYAGAALHDELQPSPVSAADARPRSLQRSPTVDGVYSSTALLQAPDANLSYYSARTFSEGSRSGLPRRHPNGLPSRQPIGPPPGLPLLNDLARRYPVRKAPASAPYVSLVSGQLLVSERLHEALARGGPVGGGLGPGAMLPAGGRDRLPSRGGSNGALQVGWSGAKAGPWGGRPASAHAFGDAVAGPGSGSGQPGRQGGTGYVGGLHPNVRAYLQHKQQLQQQHAAMHQQQLQQHQQQLMRWCGAAAVQHSGLTRPGSTALDGVAGATGVGSSGSGGLPRLAGAKARTGSGGVEDEVVYGNGHVVHSTHTWADNDEVRQQAHLSALHPQPLRYAWR